MQELHSRLQNIFRDLFEDSALDISDETTAADIDKWDSLMHIQLIVAVEKGFDVKFRNSEIARLQCVGDLKILIAKHDSKKNADQLRSAPAA